MTTINLSRLQAPDTVEQLDFEVLLAARKQTLLANLPDTLRADVAAALALESEPMTKLLEASVYQELLIRARINDAARALMLAYAVGADLDHIGANVEVPRLDGEHDQRYRSRIQQGFHRLAAAGPANAYRQHALGVSTDVIDVDVFSPAPGAVTVAVLGRRAAAVSSLDAAAIAVGRALFGDHPEQAQAYAMAATDSTLLIAVHAALNAEHVRPLTDHVVVRAPDVITYDIAASVQIVIGPDPGPVIASARRALVAYVESTAKVGADVTRAGIIAALYQPGVQNVMVTRPAADIAVAHGELAVCLSIEISETTVDA